jgi:lipopolysaccharide export system protein LptA
MHQHKVKLILSFFLLLSISKMGICFPQDKQAHVLFYADSADINQLTHHGLYIGHVQLDQGSTHIRAAEVITDGDKTNQITQAILKGSQSEQAHYWTLTSQDKPELHALADIIYYYPLRHVVKLVGHARVTQGDHSIAAAHIMYNTETQHVLSKGNAQSRTSIIILPEKHA